MASTRPSESVTSACESRAVIIGARGSGAVHVPLAQVCPDGQGVIVKLTPSGLQTCRVVADAHVAAPGVHVVLRHIPSVQDSPAAQAATV